jgi:hypothetical protein
MKRKKPDGSGFLRVSGLIVLIICFGLFLDCKVTVSDVAVLTEVQSLSLLRIADAQAYYSCLTWGN